MAGARRPAGSSPAADFDVEAAFDPDFDFDALFAADDAVDEDTPKVRVSRHRLAVAAAVTLAALPVIFLSNFQANASTPSRVDTAAEHLAPTGPPLIPDPLDTTSLPASTPLTSPSAVVFNVDAATTSSSVTVPATTATTVKVAAPTTTTTAAPAPKLVASVAPVTITTVKPAPTTTTTKPPAPTTTTTVKPAAPATTVAPHVAKPGDPSSEASWDALAKCESGGNWAANTGNGYFGGLQFSLATWQGLGGTGSPQQASKDTQIAMGKKLYQRSGWGAWPGCARNLGWT